MHLTVCICMFCGLCHRLFCIGEPWADCTPICFTVCDFSQMHPDGRGFANGSEARMIADLSIGDLYVCSHEMRCCMSAMLLHLPQSSC